MSVLNAAGSLLSNFTGQFTQSQEAVKKANQTLDEANAASLTQAAGAQAEKLATDTESSILDMRMDSVSKVLNSGQKAAKAIQF